jgi:hypothetical protein
MKRAILLGTAVALFAAAGACASSEDEPLLSSPGPDSAAPPAPDSSVDAGTEDAPDASSCNAAGWCVTDLPDPDLVLRDVWPFVDRAFALAESPAVGAKVLEWTRSDGKWKYIDDNSQNESGRGKYVGKMWSPGDDEIYFGVYPRTIFHGVRRGDDDVWSWTHEQLEDHVPDYGMPEYADHYSGRPSYFAIDSALPSLGIFGTSTDDVYAFYANTIYHATSGDGGTRTWSVDYVASDVDRPGQEQLVFLGATGTSKDDLWFSGGRGGDPNEFSACAILVRKTPDGYQRIADGSLTMPFMPCGPRPDTLLIEGAEGWLTDLHALSDHRLVGLKGARDVVEISVNGANISVSRSVIPDALSRKNLLSLWSAPNEPLWIGGFNLVLRGDDVWDGGSYGVSTIARSGAWLTMPVHQIRGSSKIDLWAVGARYALHKTTP